MGQDGLGAQVTAVGADWGRGWQYLHSEDPANSDFLLVDITIFLPTQAKRSNISNWKRYLNRKKTTVESWKFQIQSTYEAFLRLFFLKLPEFGYFLELLFIWSEAFQNFIVLAYVKVHQHKSNGSLHMNMTALMLCFFCVVRCECEMSLWEWK